jgi:hypothetical protein
MEEKYGLIKGMRCQLHKTDPELIKVLSHKTGIDAVMVKEMLLYNVFTVSQFAQISGLAVSTITNKTRPLMIDGKYDTELDYCYLHPDKEGDGPKFIVRNKKSEKYLTV